MATGVDVAAWIGAAAWVPQIGRWVYKALVKPKVRIIPDSRVSVGYTNFGAIFNVRVAISSDHIDAILDRITATLTHEGGDKHEFHWVSLRETFSQIIDEEGHRQTVERDQPAIALRVSTSLLSEKFILFQEPAFHSARQPLWDKAVEEHNRLKATVATYREDTLASKEMFDAHQFYQSRFWWQPGQYSVRFEIKSANGATLEEARFAFSLLKSDVDAMRGNVAMLKTDWANTVMEGVPEYHKEPIFWVWREPMLTPISTPDSASRLLKKGR